MSPSASASSTTRAWTAASAGAMKPRVIRYASASARRTSTSLLRGQVARAGDALQGFEQVDQQVLATERGGEAAQRAHPRREPRHVVGRRRRPPGRLQVAQVALDRGRRRAPLPRAVGRVPAIEPVEVVRGVARRDGAARPDSTSFAAANRRTRSWRSYRPETAIERDQGGAHEIAEVPQGGAGDVARRRAVEAAVEGAHGRQDVALVRGERQPGALEDRREVAVVLEAR